jgi:glycosyltransferase involved in cell wall biosynthesis
MGNKRLAIVHDMIVDKGGAERVLYCFHLAYPDAPIFTTAFLPRSTYPEFTNIPIRSTWYDKIATTSERYRKLYFPLGFAASRSIDLSEYDIILQSTTHGAKYAKVRSDALVISYCYTPFRLVWNTDSYPQVSRSSTVKKKIFEMVIGYLKAYDYASAQRPDYYFAMTKETAERIRNNYHKPVQCILPPPVDCSKFFISNQSDDYYLIVSRLEPYKKVDVAIRAFNTLGLKLKIVGNGTQKKHLQSIAKNNIEFLSEVTDHDLQGLYSRMRALIFPQHEDYGITPLEAIASGRPVIAYARGGVLETMIRYTPELANTATAVLFEEQTEGSLIEAIRKAEGISFNRDNIRKHAEKFDTTLFINKFKKSVEFCIHDFYGEEL